MKVQNLSYIKNTIFRPYQTTIPTSSGDYKLDFTSLDTSDINSEIVLEDSGTLESGNTYVIPQGMLKTDESNNVYLNPAYGEIAINNIPLVSATEFVMTIDCYAGSGYEFGQANARCVFLKDANNEFKFFRDGYTSDGCIFESDTEVQSTTDVGTIFGLYQVKSPQPLHEIYPIINQIKYTKRSNGDIEIYINDNLVSEVFSAQSLSGNVTIGRVSGQNFPAIKIASMSFNII